MRARSLGREDPVEEEMAHEDEFDAVVVNGEVDAAALDIWDLMKNLY